MTIPGRLLEQFKALRKALCVFHCAVGALRLTCLVCLLLFSATSLSATELQLPIHPISSNEQLHGSVISDVIRGGQGFLWITTDNGLFRYDGYELKSVGRKTIGEDFSGITYAAGLHLDSESNLWVLSSHVNRYDPAMETFEQFNISDGKVVRALHKDQNQVLWYGGDGFGFRGYDLKSGKIVHQSMQSIRAQRIVAIDSAPGSSLLWIGSSAGLFRFDTETYQLDYVELPLGAAIDAETIRDVAVGKSGKVWVASSLGLFSVDVETKEAHVFFAHNKAIKLGTNDLWSVFEDSKGHVWTGTDKKGLYRLPLGEKVFEHIPTASHNSSKMPPAAITNIYEDENGTVWLSASQFGVYRLNENLQRFTAYKHNPDDADGLGFRNAKGMLEDEQGNIWIATDGGGIDVLDLNTNTFAHHRHKPHDPQSLSGDSVISLAQDTKGTIWISTWGGGLNWYDPKTSKFGNLQKQPQNEKRQGLATNNIFNVFVDSKGGLYLSVWMQGLQYYNPSDGTFKNFNPKGVGAGSGIQNADVNVIVEDDDGILWVGGYVGLEKFDTNTEMFAQINIGNQISITDMYLDQELDRLWIATSEGLVRFDILTEDLKRYDLSSDPSSNYLVSLEVDAKGELWLGSRNGLFHFDPATEDFQLYDQRDGLAGNKFNMYSSLKTRDGKLYFGGTNGVTTFDPNNFPRNEIPPPVVMTGFELFQKAVDIDSEGLLTKSVNSVDKILLEHIQRDISFEFAALNFISPEKNRYKYRLLGLEGDWTYADGLGRRVRYTNLSPGKYRFQVLAANNDGFWNKEGAFVDVEVTPPWWMHWWFRGLLGFIFVTFSSLFFYWRMWLNIQQKKLLQLKIDEKTSELKDAHASLQDLNIELEKRVDIRTNELSVEVEERRIAEEKLFYMAFHDGLTGLYNRAWLLQQIAKLIKRTHTEDGFQFALLFLDGDRFKQINDTHGHALGDLLLVAAAHRLQDLLPDKHHAIRLGGDEFTILIEGIENANQIVGIAELVTSAFEEPFKIEQNLLYFKVSIGMVLCDEYYEQPEQILRDADIALYKSKELGKGVYQMFDTNMREETIELAELEADLQTAIANNEFHLVYQPIIDLETRELISFEALLRWIHPTRGFIPPDKFIPLAEESGAIFSIGLWVLKEACQQLKLWLNQFEFKVDPIMAVNLSPLQLGQPDLMERFDEVISEAEINCRLLKLEITESALMQQTDLVNSLLEKVRLRGIELAIDDFGTGYSSLSYLDQLPVQVLKIDRTFVNGLSSHREALKREGAGGASEIVKATISLAHALNMKVVAEGIEQESQLQSLLEMGCDFGQGYFIAKPLNALDATDYLKSLFPENENYKSKNEGDLAGVQDVAADMQVQGDRRSNRRNGLQ